MRVFLGITGASGAPYAERLLRALAAADCEIGLTASGSGIEVLATELYGDPSLPREEVLERFVGDSTDRVTVYGEGDFSSPYASGSALVDAYVVCPCSMATVGTLASGAMQNLIHRAASVALKEAAEARARPAGDTALVDPPAWPRDAERRGRDHPLRGAGLLPRPDVDRRPRGLRRRALPRPDRRQKRGGEAVGPVSAERQQAAGSFETGRLEADDVRSMFDRIAPVYDVMNHVMTAGLDRRWRRLAVREVVWPGDRVLDACCGTGDLALEAERRGAHVVGLDFSERMLERARAKSGTIEWVHGDALALPFGEQEFDAATVGFGVRNLEDLAGGLGELRRVLRPGGKLAVLEITRPRGLLRPFFRLWFDVLVPLAGKILPGGKAYTYLPASVRRFPAPADLSALLESAGFEDVRFRLLGGGIVALHVAERPRLPSGSEPQGEETDPL